MSARDRGRWPPSQEPLVDLGDLVRRRRLALDLSQGDLAGLAGTGVSSVYGLERGLASLTLSTVIRLADALDLEITVTPTSGPQFRQDPVVLNSARGSL